jgi:multidrug efflux pump subunit AcrB
LKKKIRTAAMPSNIKLVYGGATKRTEQALTTLGTAFAISILLVYLILVALYDSFYYPLVVLFSIPMAVIGALFALALTQQSLSIFSVLGLIMLVGLVGKNAIIVVDFTNKLRIEGLDLKEALRQATRIRFRPVLMTNLAMIIGLLPIALATGAASEWKNGLAWALIGGLSSSMLLTLVIVPLVYYSLTRTLEKLRLIHLDKIKID